MVMVGPSGKWRDSVIKRRPWIVVRFTLQKFPGKLLHGPPQGRLYLDEREKFTLATKLEVNFLLTNFVIIAWLKKVIR